MSNLLRAEALKLRTTRAPYALLLALLLMSALAAAAVVGADGLDEIEREIGVGDAAEVSSILAVMLGILLVTNEFRHGTITPTFLITPVREKVVAAKHVVGGIAGLVAGVAAAVVAFAIAVPWLAARDEPLDGGEVVLAALRLVGSFGLHALLGVAIGTLLRGQIAAIIATFAWFFVVEPLLWGLGELVDVDLMPYLPGSALDAIVSADDGELLAPGWGALLSVGYIALLTGVGTWLMVRRDAD